jgi:hypothetical protein
MLKIFQTIRLLSRNPKIHLLLYEERILIYFESIFEKLMNTNKSSQNNNAEIFDNLLIEIISIIKRYFTNINLKPEEQKEEIKSLDNVFVQKIINDTKLLDQMIFLLNKENTTILRLLHFILISAIKKLKILFFIFFNIGRKRLVNLRGPILLII